MMTPSEYTPPPDEGVPLPPERRGADPHERVILAVIYVLGFIALLTVAGSIYLVAGGKPVPDAFIAIGSSAVASIGTLLARG